jgi:hypothetical protein
MRLRPPTFHHAYRTARTPGLRISRLPLDSGPLQTGVETSARFLRGDQIRTGTGVV